MADTGLQNIKLQDGYVKLLHTKGNDGVNDFVTQVGTSNGPNIVGTPLYLGSGGDTQNPNPMIKIKAIESTKPFLIITDSLGTWNAGQDEYPILTFVADGSLTGTDYWGASNLNKGRGVWNGKCMFNFAEGGNRSAVEFMCHSSSDVLSSSGGGESTFATIRKASSGNNVMFAQPYGKTEYWQFDRVKIGSDLGSQAKGSAVADFDADGVDAKFGNMTADGFYHGVVSATSALTHSVDINATDSLKFAAGGDTTFINGSNDTFEVYGNKFLTLQADGAGINTVGAVVSMEAYRYQGGGGTSQINIGTDDTQSKDFGAGSVTMSGAQSIQIGNAGISGNAYVNANKTYLNSKEVIVNSGMMVFDTAAADWTNYDAVASPADYGALFFQSSSYTIDTNADYGRQLFLYDDDGSPSLYTIDKTQVGKAKVLELRDTTATSTTPTTVTDLPASSAQIYMKGGKLIIAFDDAGVARYLKVDLAALTGDDNSDIQWTDGSNDS